MPIVRSTIVILSLFLAPVTFSAATELGFKTLSDPTTPPSLRQAANSVFEVIIPYEQTPQEV